MHDDDGWTVPETGSSEQGSLLGRVVRYVLLFFGVWLLIGLLLNAAATLLPNARRVEQEARVAPAPEPQEAQVALADGGYEMVVPADGSGHFLVEGSVDGIELGFLVDTGATTVVLAPDDATRLGFDTQMLEYNRRLRTANGDVAAAAVTLSTLRIGDLELADVSATVVDAPLSTSLLGMSALGRLASYEVQDNRLVLRW